MPRTAKQPGRGTLGGARDKNRNQRVQRARRMASPRVYNALAAAAADRDALDKLIASQERDAAARAVTLTTSSAPPTLILKPSRAVPDTSQVPPADARGEKGWTLGQARTMLRDGYRLSRVVATTGWGRDWLADLLGPDGIYAVQQ